MNTAAIPIEIENVTIIVYVVDLDRAVQFYHEVLGFQIGFRKDGWCEMRHHGTTIGLRGGKGKPSGRTGIAIQVPNIQEALDRIARSGGSVVENPRRRDNLGIYYGVVLDTEGNELMLSQVLE